MFLCDYPYFQACRRQQTEILGVLETYLYSAKNSRVCSSLQNQMSSSKTRIINKDKYKKESVGIQFQEHDVCK